MKANRALDALVHEKIFGKSAHVVGWGSEKHPRMDVYTTKHPTWIDIQGEMRILDCDIVPQYSRKIKAAFLIVRKISKFAEISLKTRLPSGHKYKPRKYFCEIVCPVGMGEVIHVKAASDVAAEAICLAALALSERL